MAEHPQLALTGVSRAFDGARAVEDISLSLTDGEVICLLGPSGCGKSTTLRLVAGVDTPDAGEIHIAGRKVADARQSLPPERRGVGLMFQDFALFPHLNVADNVAFGIKGGADEKKARVGQLLERVGLSTYGSKYPHMLSGGEQQRVALARALAPKPTLLLMDEPFSGLDDRLRDEVRDTTLDILRSEGTGVLLVTHEPAEAMRMADRIILMRDGKIVQEGAPHNMYNYPVDQQAAAFFSDTNVVTGLVQAGTITSPFGEFFAPGFSDGEMVDIVFRPQHLHLDFHRSTARAKSDNLGMAATAKVIRARFMGTQTLVEFQADYSSTPLKALIPGQFLPPPGTKFSLSLRRDKCWVFPKVS
ncbi:MAG: ABC transporter ATP-binding protein [Pseudomonadota bacterium]